MVISQPRFGRRLYTAVLICAALASLIFVLAGCGAATTGSNAPLVVLVDSTRLAGVQLYQKTHPDVPIQIETLADRSSIPEKILLYNRAAGGGWPDVVFAEPNIVGKVSDAPHHFPLDLTPYVPKSIINSFANGALAGCEIDGHLYCLRNDLAQEVLWYNADLMKRFGYQVPTTWQQYQALGFRVAKEHPGYIIGAFGDSSALDMYYWPGGCPTNQLLGSNRVRIDLSNANCTRVTKMLQPLIDAGVIPKLGPFDPSFVKEYGSANKILMMPAASWYGQYVFQASYNIPKGQLAVGMPLAWEGESPHSGAQGGSAWMVSSQVNPQRIQEAVNIAIWMSTDNTYQATAPTFPAYLPAADAWSKNVVHDPYFATNPYPVLRQAAGLIDTRFGNVRYDPESIFGTTVIASVIRGQSITSAMPACQMQLTQMAQDYGYTVVS